MKHSITELIQIIYSYFPRGMHGDEANYEQTPEYLRRMAARTKASTKFRDWCAMLDRIHARFPARLRDVGVENGSPFLESAGASTLDRCFTGALWLPAREPTESHHQLEFFVSFVVPYYFIHSSWMVPLARPMGRISKEPKLSFDFTPDELPFVAAIEEEISVTFPGHEPMPASIGKTIVPDVKGGGNLYGESTIYGCLFSDKW